MGGIFICYRREDAAPYAGWLHHTLRDHFREEQLVRDIHNIVPGDRFPDTSHGPGHVYAALSRGAGTAASASGGRCARWATSTATAGRTR